MTNINDFVVSSRVRLARNIVGMPFPGKLKDKRAEELAARVYSALKETGSYDLLSMKALDEISKGALKERHIISAALIDNSDFGALILSRDRKISVMVCEEDCVREQSIVEGFDLEQAYGLVNNADDTIAKAVNFCFDPRLGYLTSCPTNLGTGMRASAMMFLPGLTYTNNMQTLINKLSNLNITVRGVYGEGSSAEGFLYQVSNLKSLGVSEAEIIAGVTSAVTHIADLERQARAQIKSASDAGLKDRIMRALGALLYAYRMESAEFMEKAALIKLGLHFGYFEEFDMQRLETLIIEAQPYCLQKKCGRMLDAGERDIFRAKTVSDELKLLNITGIDQ